MPKIETFVKGISDDHLHGVSSHVLNFFMGRDVIRIPFSSEELMHPTTFVDQVIGIIGDDEAILRGQLLQSSTMSG